ncbi:hypothetical protein B0H63DRAFT_528977 [Podospora didyma]|uniref:Uncharacterized protein n=1 Tax=Podospora didyma TaxID=330526 RepID=A0AAE0K364_9PEZI|nr:hypothetical protein B0H63DRAFT_528977 [Podospora didyma]
MPLSPSLMLSLGLAALIAPSLGTLIDLDLIPRGVTGAISNPLAPGVYALEGANFQGNQSWAVSYSKEHGRAVWEEQDHHLATAPRNLLEKRQNDKGKPSPDAKWGTSTVRWCPEDPENTLPAGVCRETEHVAELQRVDPFQQDRLGFREVPPFSLDDPTQPVPSSTQGQLLLYTSCGCEGNPAIRLALREYMQCVNTQTFITQARIFSIKHARSGR